MDKKIPKYILVQEKIKHAIKHKEIAGKLPGERTLAKGLWLFLHDDKKSGR